MGEQAYVVNKTLWRAGLPCVGLRSSPYPSHPNLPENSPYRFRACCAAQRRASLLTTTSVPAFHNKTACRRWQVLNVDGAEPKTNVDQVIKTLAP
jgi:hypothetical protein